MEEQEGINLETINSVNDDSVILSANGDDAEDVVNNDVPDNTNLVDEEKESLKRGLNAERKARKEAEKKNKEFETRLLALEKANEPKEKTTLEELVENGVDEDIAKSIAGAIDKRQSNTSKVENELRDMKFRYELSEKSKDDNFSDILDFEDEIKSLVGKGLTIEQSYYALNYKNLKSINTKSEIERKVVMFTSLPFPDFPSFKIDFIGLCRQQFVVRAMGLIILFDKRSIDRESVVYVAFGNKVGLNIHIYEFLERCAACRHQTDLIT